MFKRIGVLLLIFSLVFTLAACSGGQKDAGKSQEPASNIETGSDTAYPVTIVDSLGKELTIEAEPQKIISLSPAITEILFAIGVEDKIVGVTDYCDYPAEAQEKPKVGGFENPNLEVIIEAEPDVLFTAAGIQTDMVQQFEDLGIKVVTLDAENVRQILENIEVAGIVTGATSEATELTSSMEERIKAVEEKVAGIDKKPTVFFEVWDNPLMTAGPGSFIDDVIKIAGGQNVAADASKKFAEFSLEMIIDRNPEVYLVNAHAHTPSDVKSRPGYAGLTAVQNDEVYAIDDDPLTLPGPRIVDGLENIAEIIHPELFK